ncbi:hypothetical protein CI610_03546 [invertebrate metagenome]|uniref:Membrane transporter protein n=1 Tax=invertebrate metagenome TaxID=1711999 RepID=A0A2H9T2S2_9ZZZZ
MEALIIFLSAGTLFIGGLTQGMVGFGLGMVSVPLLSIFMDVKMAVPIATIFGWLITIPVVCKMYHYVQWKTAICMYLPAIIGVELGGNLLYSLNSGVILLIMGAVLFIVGGLTLIQRPIRVKNSLKSAGICGFLSGVLGATAGESGPPIVTYMNVLDWSAEKIKATMNFYFLLAMATVIFKIYRNGQITHDIAIITAWSLPAMLLGGLIGMSLFSWVQRKHFDAKKIMNTVLVVLGLMLIYKGIHLMNLITTA